MYESASFIKDHLSYMQKVFTSKVKSVYAEKLKYKFLMIKIIIGARPIQQGKILWQLKKKNRGHQGRGAPWNSWFVTRFWLGFRVIRYKILFSVKRAILLVWESRVPFVQEPEAALLPRYKKILFVPPPLPKYTGIAHP